MLGNLPARGNWILDPGSNFECTDAAMSGCDIYLQSHVALSFRAFTRGL